MIDLLRRSLAPLTEKTWEAIDDAAAQTLKSLLTARAIVDFDGPRGWEFAAVNLGRLSIPESSGGDDVPWGKRLVLPLVEIRLPLHMPQMELDSIARGARDGDVTAIEEAARRAAMFEESAVYNGFEAGGIKGIIPQSAHDPIDLPANVQEYPRAVAMGLRELRLAGIDGPYFLVLGSEAWAGLMQGVGGYPPHRVIERLIGSPVRMSPAIHGGVLLSGAKGHFELTVGQDFSIGYLRHDGNEVELYLTESFAFRVLQPKAAVHLAPR